MSKKDTPRKVIPAMTHNDSKELWRGFLKEQSTRLTTTIMHKQ
jgi:hypothetical protein